MRISSVLLCLLATVAPYSYADGLEFAGALGNSGGSDRTIATFSAKPACGIGPVLDADNTIWERAGSAQLNRYTLDGRLLASFELPDSNNKFRDQLTLAGDHLLFHLGKNLYRLKVNEAPGTKAEKLEGNADLMAPSAFRGRGLIFDNGEIAWLDPSTGDRKPIVKNIQSLRHLFAGEDGTVFAFTGREVLAWKDGVEVPGYPRPFRGARPQKIGDFWYSHGYHGTVHRFNELFEPAPGVVLGGASGSFIGYLPQNGDINHGTGLVRIRDDLFAISGFEGIVQFLQWQETDMRFEVVRRIGALQGLKSLGLDAEGNIWTPRGSWRWADSSEAPRSLGDVEPEFTTQPVILGGKTIAFIKSHYGNMQKARGSVIDSSGWSHLEARGIGNLTLSKTAYGSAAFTNSKGQLRMLVTGPDGKAMDFSISENGDIGDRPDEVQLPGLTRCSSLAWFDGHIVATDRGALVILRETVQGVWETAKRLEGFGEEIFVHSDGTSLVVSDARSGRVSLYNALDPGATIASYDGLDWPEKVAVSGDRIVVYEAGKQRLVKLHRGEAAPLHVPAEPRVDAIGTKKWDFPEGDFYELGRAGGIPIAVATRERDGGLDVALDVPDNATEVILGVANATDHFIVHHRDARIPAADWSEIRLAAFVKLPDQQERVGFVDHQPVHARFSNDPAHWARFDFRNYREIIAERKEQIRIEFDQAIDGKASLVIENEAGQRIRNLVSGRSFRPGKHTVVWDGLDEDGQLVAPGSYRWRGITHPGIRPEYRMSFAGGREPINARPWGPNHGILHDAVSNREQVLFAAPVTEGGWALLALDADGNFVQGYDHQQGFGIGHNAIAVDDNYLYCAQDGFGWSGANDIDWKSERWKSTWTLTVARYDLKSGKPVEFHGKKRAVVIDTMEVGPGSKHPDLKSYNLSGLAILDGQLYVGSRDKNSVFVHDAATAERLRTIPLKDLRDLATGQEAVFAATDSGIVSLNDGKEVASTRGLKITGLTVAPDGDFWVSDRASHQVHHFSAEGKRIGSIGTPGGPYKGVYDPNRMVNPTGLTFGPEGKLWVTENRWNPKRVMAWDTEKKTVVYEKFGIPHYGGDGSGFDPEDRRRWIGLGCFWNIDIETGAARPTHMMSIDEAHFEHYHPQGYSFFREAGRTFLSARGKIALLLEVLVDGTTRKIAAASGTHHFAYGCDWDPPRAYIEAFYTKWPHKRGQEKPGRGADGKPWAGRVAGVLWVDRNSDGETQREEFTFTEEGVQFADGHWGHLQDSLTLRFPAAVGEQVKIIEIKPRGFLPNGIPDYPTLNEAIENGATDISLTPGYKRQGVSTAKDRFGRFVFNSDPELNAFGADGEHLWSYPNQWSDVHGSHDAPLPETGVLQGSMAILGMVPFDNQADVFFLNGNHGRCFLLTSDGIYLDETFTDVRVSYLQNEYRLGGEIFGGTFERSQKDGNYYVQIGHGPYRIYQLQGLDKARRISGEFGVTADQIAAAERGNMRQIAKTQTTKSFQLPGEIAWDLGGKFKVALSAAIEGEHLHLNYKVQDPSPWINNGRDWTTLFATGDTVDLQIGVNPNADANRREPVEGDQRLLIAPHDGKPIAVLYQHRKPGGTNPIEFTSPWRGAQVDHVEQLTDVKIEVKTSGGGYVIEAKVPLAALRLEPSGTLRADFGVTYGDAGGTDTQLRSYWANQATMLMDDIPGEILLHPNLWGELHLEGSQD
jgi:sugar lactone lactonase YvrE